MNELVIENGPQDGKVAAAAIEIAATAAMGGLAFELGKEATRQALAGNLGKTAQDAAKGIADGVTAGAGRMASGIIELTNPWVKAGEGAALGAVGAALAGSGAAKAGIKAAEAGAKAAAPGAMKAADTVVDKVIDGAKKLGKDIIETPNDVYKHVKENPIKSITQGVVSPGLIILDAKLQKYLGK